jgi:hypothetical protein
LPTAARRVRSSVSMSVRLSCSSSRILRKRTT